MVSYTAPGNRIPPSALVCCYGNYVLTYYYIWSFIIGRKGVGGIDSMTPRQIQNFPEIAKFPMAAQYKSWVRGVSLIRVAGSNTAGGVDIFLLRVLFVVR